MSSDLFFLRDSQFWSICQLFDACTVVCENSNIEILHSAERINQIMQARDDLEISASAGSILRGYHLICLTDCCDEWENYHASQLPKQAERKIATENESYERSTDLMTKTYPDLKRPQGRRREDENQKNLKPLQNKFSIGRDWNLLHLLQQRFSPDVPDRRPTMKLLALPMLQQKVIMEEPHFRQQQV